MHKNAKKALKLSQVTSIKNCHTHTQTYIYTNKCLIIPNKIATKAKTT